jgi:hypothetical protein
MLVAIAAAPNSIDNSIIVGNSDFTGFIIRFDDFSAVGICSKIYDDGEH